MMTDLDVLDVLDVFTEIVTPALFIDAKFLALVICRMVCLSLEHGNCDGSCYAYVWLGMLAGPHFGNYQAGFQFGKLGYDLVEERGLRRSSSDLHVFWNSNRPMDETRQGSARTPPSLLHRRQQNRRSYVCRILLQHLVHELARRGRPFG